MENTLNSKVHEKISDWTAKLDNYLLQFSLGKMEAKDEYVKQKKELHDYLQKYIQSGEHFKNVAEQKVDSIIHTFDELKKEFQKEEEATEKTISEHKKAIENLLDKTTVL